jgi:uncharacterized integral membrane protein
LITLVFVLIIVAAVAVFSVQNAAPVGVSFLGWRFEASLAVVIVLSVLAGMISGMALMSWFRFRRSSQGKRPPDQAPTNSAGSK